MLENEDIWLTLEEFGLRQKKDLGYLSEPRLRKLVQEKAIIFKKEEYIRSLIEFSANDIILQDRNLKEFLKNNKIKVLPAIGLDHNSATLEEYADSLNGFFQNHFETIILPIFDWHKILYQIKTYKQLDPRINYKDKLEFLNFSSLKELTKEGVNEYINKLNLLEKKILVRLLVDLDANNIFESPFRNIPTKYGEIINDTFAREPDDKRQRDVEKYLISKKSLDEYLNDYNDIYPVLENLHFLKNLDSCSDLKWTICREWGISPSEEIEYNKEKPSLAEIKAVGNIIWQPNFEGRSDWPDLIIDNLKAIYGNKELKLMTFFPKAFMSSKYFKNLRNYLANESKMDAVILIKSTELNLDHTLILFTPVKPDGQSINYSEVTNFKTLLILLKKVLKGEKLEPKLTINIDVWQPDR